MKRTISLLFVAIALTACATSPDAPSFTVAPVPKLVSDKAILYIYREYAEPTAWSAYLQIDDKEAVSMAQQGFTWVYVSGGNHNFTFGWPLLAGMPDVKFERTFEAGKAYAFEMKGRVVGDIRYFKSTSAIQPMDIEAAKAKMTKCCRYVPPQAQAF